VSLSDKSPYLERFLKPIRHRHPRAFSLASSERPFLRRCSFTQGAYDNLAATFRTALQVSLNSPLPSVSIDGSYSAPTLSHSRGLTRLKRSIAASFVSDHRIFSRQSGVSCAFHSSACSGSNCSSPSLGDYSRDRSVWSALAPGIP
jgi:hypothetical protein